MVVDCFNNRLSLWCLRDSSLWKHLDSRLKKKLFIHPRAVAVTQAGALVVSDGSDLAFYRVQVLTMDGKVLSVLNPSRFPLVGELMSCPRGVAVCVGTDDILVTDGVGRRIVAMTWVPVSKVQSLYTHTIDILDYYLFYCYHMDNYNTSLELIVQSGYGKEMSVQAWGKELGQSQAHGVVAMSTGLVWVADSEQHRLNLFRIVNQDH